MMKNVYEAFAKVGEATRRELGIFNEEESKRLLYLKTKGFKEHEARVIVKLEYKYPVTLDELRIFDEIMHKEVS